MLYHAFSSDPEGTVPDWTYKVSCDPRIIGLQAIPRDSLSNSSLTTAQT
jgi:hypothetical protein